MWMQPFNVMDEAELRPMVTGVGSAELITVGDDGFPLATRLPVIWEERRLVLHMAIANPHWRTIAEGAPALAVVTGPEAYITPTWYASKREHGRVVPTWNYSAIQFRGRATVHRDPEWLLAAVTGLTDLHEEPREGRWSVGDAPEPFVRQQLRAIVGIELEIDTIRGKAKRSQNRTDEDRRGVIAGLRAEGGSREGDLAAQMEADLEGRRR